MEPTSLGAALGAAQAAPLRAMERQNNRLRTDTLILDGTYLTCRAYNRKENTLKAFETFVRNLCTITSAQSVVVTFDAAPQTKKESIRRQALDDYKMKRERLQAQTSPAVRRRNLDPYLHCLRNINAGCVIAPDGFEADDAIHAVVQMLTDPDGLGHKVEQSGLWPAGLPTQSVCIASGDRDMQQLITERVSWLHLLPRASRQSPEGHKLVALEDFVSEFGFHPQHYAQFQALAGKQESGVRGAPGVGAKAAKKLIKRYSSVEHVCQACTRGELKGYHKQVQAGVHEACASGSGLKALEVVRLYGDLIRVPQSEIGRPVLLSRSPLYGGDRGSATLVNGQLRSSGKPSDLQRSVAFILTRKLGHAITEEFFTEEGFSIDIIVHADAAKGLAQAIALEVDGPSHFTADGAYTGKTKYKHRNLRRLGWPVASVSYLDWNRAASAKDKAELLATLLRSAATAAAARTTTRSKTKTRTSSKSSKSSSSKS